MRFQSLLFALFFFLSVHELCAVDYFFYVQFTDKNNSPYSLSNPAEFLSERAIDRRQYFHISCDSTDLPVNPSYISRLREANVEVYNTTKWLNGATVFTSDSSAVYDIEKLSCVKWVEYTGKKTSTFRNEVKLPKSKKQEYKVLDEYYGAAFDQINQIRGIYLHDLGYKGKDIHIALLDAGFKEVDVTPAYNLLFMQNRLLGTKDFVDVNANVYNEHYHGAYVLSTIAAELPGQYVGTAPEASFWLIRTEEQQLEYPLEMDCWIAGIEFADSVGVDVVNSSLGYTIFDNPCLSLEYDKLDGNQVRISKAAEIASSKGIIVVNSAGNDGNKSWKYLGVPADAKGIITVGSVDINGNESAFSSYGPTADGRVKPEIAARGTSTALVNRNGVTYSNGTSFSSPVIAGMMACFLQAAKEKYQYITLENLFRFVYETGSNYNNPTTKLGYGIPDFEFATNQLLGTNSLNYFSNDNIRILADSMSKTIQITFEGKEHEISSVQLYSINGELLFNETITYPQIRINTIDFPAGIYAVCLFHIDGKITSQKIILY